MSTFLVAPLFAFSVAFGVAFVVAFSGPSVAGPSSRDREILDRLVAAYPNHLAGHEGGVLIWKDGTRMAFDDGRGKKPFQTLLNSPDLEDQFYTSYPTGRRGVPPGKNIDPGRVRYEPFFTKIYGDCRKGEVARNLIDIVWLPKKYGKRLKVTGANNVALQLQKVSAELDALPKKFDKYLYPSAGTYNCRTIAGTKRLSVHAFGAAIDLNTKHAHYWRWSKRNADDVLPYKNAIPWEIVEIFERHGFIWGGKWYHYDTMHFEYRPELIKR